MLPASLGLSSSIPRRSSLLKRNVADAGLESGPFCLHLLAFGLTASTGAGPRKSLPTSSTVTLQRRILALEAREMEQTQKIEEQWEEIERLRGQRRVLLEGETYERETGEEREKEWSDERVRGFHLVL